MQFSLQALIFAALLCIFFASWWSELINPNQLTSREYMLSFKKKKKNWAVHTYKVIFVEVCVSQESLRPKTSFKVVQAQALHGCIIFKRLRPDHLE